MEKPDRDRESKQAEAPTRDRYAGLREFYEHFADEEESAIRVGYRSAGAQLIRFEVLLDALDPAAYPASVLDVGCGVGDLFAYLRATGRLGRYVGLDILPEMIEEARRRFPEVEVVAGDILGGAVQGQFDLVVSSGALNATVDDHDRWARDMLGAMWSHTEGTLAVNFASTRAYRYDVQARFDEEIRYLEPRLVLEWCESLTPWVTLRQDYLPHDATVYLYRDHHRSAVAMRDRTWTRWAESPASAVSLARIFADRGLPAEALAALERVEPTAEVLFTQGSAHQALRNFQAARKAYRAALDADPSFEKARLGLKWLDDYGL